MEKKELEIYRIQKKYADLSFCLNERTRRLWAAAEAKSYGRGGISLVSKATGISKNTVRTGLKELNDPNRASCTRIRRDGGGRKKITAKNKNILSILDDLVDSTSRGNPESPLKWTSKSLRKLARELKNRGHKACFNTVASLLKNELNYSLQSNRKTKEGASHADRDEQFHYINNSVMELQKRRQPTISVDTKKKENIGEYKNNGQEYAKKGTPVKVNTHDFPDKRLGKVVPYGVYDIGSNTGWVSVGISADTAEFAVNTIRIWWYTMGEKQYRDATELLITADCGGSNGYRVRLWKSELQKFANEIGLQIHVRHFPPGTSKWNKIEHRLFSYISKNWRGKPLESVETVVNLIGNTTTHAGLTVTAVLDRNEYQKGRTIDDDEISALNIQNAEFHPEWNYTISPQIV